ncbi:hypothetical protein NDU88_002887 [Pleurodeles waltl]|uniref:Uncharacterized protein n=1 Tax=Pleurodeles waltl TaxID=8319 RepID=A0AAV7UYE9_PLEWA|nr:hypothetical protein NDU88_002887 [Pleurodeles waltl]
MEEEDRRRRKPLTRGEQARRGEEDRRTKEGDANEDARSSMITEMQETRTGEDGESETFPQEDATPIGRASGYNSRHVPGGMWLSQLNITNGMPRPSVSVSNRNRRGCP